MPDVVYHEFHLRFCYEVIEWLAMRAIEWRSRLRIGFMRYRMQLSFPSILAMQLSTGDIIILLEITTFVFLIALLYNLIFAVVSLRKILKRADTVTKQVEQVVLKPISIADATVDWVTHLLEGHPKKTAKQTATKKKSAATKKK